MSKKVTDKVLIDTANTVYGQFCRYELKVTDMENSVKKINEMQRAINLLIKRGYTYTADSEHGSLNFTREATEQELVEVGTREPRIDHYLYLSGMNEEE